MGFSDEMPTLLVHGWWNINGGEDVEIHQQCGGPQPAGGGPAWNPCAITWCATSPPERDANFDADRLVMLYNTELANDLQPSNRSINMTRRYCESVLPAPGEYDDDASEACAQPWTRRWSVQIHGREAHGLRRAGGPERPGFRLQRPTLNSSSPSSCRTGRPAPRLGCCSATC